MSYTCLISRAVMTCQIAKRPPADHNVGQKHMPCSNTLCSRVINIRAHLCNSTHWRYS